MMDYSKSWNKHSNNSKPYIF